MQSLSLKGIAYDYRWVESETWVEKKSLLMIFLKFYRCSSSSRTYVLSFLMNYYQIYYKLQLLSISQLLIEMGWIIVSQFYYLFSWSMHQRIKTPDNRGTKTFRSKRCKTIGPESCLRQQYRYHTILQTRNIISETDGLKSHLSNIQLNNNRDGSAFKTPRLLDRYDEDNQNLTTDFATEWSRMDSIKRQTYSRLRNKLVKKYPSFRQKYKTEDISQQAAQPSVRQSKRSQSENKNRVDVSLHSTNKINQINIFKTGYFYSRSQKKCLYNSFTAGEAPEQQRQTPIPRMSFLNYIKNNKQRQALKFKKVKGQNMIKTRDKILNLQKEGTQSFLGLKKCLDESIEACIRGK